MNHLEFAKIESRSLELSEWEFFVSACEDACRDFLHEDYKGNLSFDGDADVEGYSLGELFDLYLEHKSPNEVYRHFSEKMK